MTHLVMQKINIEITDLPLFCVKNTENATSAMTTKVRIIRMMESLLQVQDPE